MDNLERAEHLVDGTAYSLDPLVLYISPRRPQDTLIANPTTSTLVANDDRLGINLLNLIETQIEELAETVPTEGKTWKEFSYTSVLEGTPERIDYIGYANQLAPDILSGEKTLTARYDFTRPLVEGKTVDFTDEDDRVFATATVDRIEETTVESFATTDHDGHASYDSVDDLLSTLSTYYPDADITASSTLTVIHYKGVEPTETGRSEYL